MRRQNVGPLAAVMLAWAVSGCGGEATHVPHPAPDLTTATTAASKAIGPGTNPSPAAVSTTTATITASDAVASPGNSASNPPHLTVCGRSISTSAVDGLIANIASDQLVATLPGTTVGARLIVRVSNSCDNGSDVVIAPSRAFQIVRTIRAADGLAVAVEIRRMAAIGATLSVTTPDGRRLRTLHLPRST
jgi:hypothetical protein